ncbi:MAG: type II secretion system F family protein [Bacteroidota bacterium]
MGFKLEQALTAKTDSSQQQGDIESLLKRDIVLFGTFFNSKKKEDFYTELAVLLKAGVHLREALELLGNNQKKEKLRQFYASMLEDLDLGHGFYEILRARKEFTEYEYYSVQIGEESGNLVQIAEELGNFYSRKNEQRRNLVNAMTYPLIILSTALLVVVFMLRVIVPMFEDIFRQNGVDLPQITKGIIAVSNFIKGYGWGIMGLFVALIVFRRPIFKRAGMKRFRDRALLKLPYIGHFIRSVYLAQFTQAVALLTASKVPVLQSLQMVRRMIGFYPLYDALVAMESEIIKGASLHGSIKDNPIFDHKMASLIKVAEETNQTEYIFDRLSQQYRLEVQQKSKMLTTVMEPLIIVVIGLFVGVILVSIYLPMFKLSSVLG